MAGRSAWRSARTGSTLKQGCGQTWGYRSDNTFWTNLTTWFTQILLKQNTDFVHFIYSTSLLNWPLNLALLHGNKKKCYLAKALTEHWSNGIDERSKYKHSTIRQQWQRSDPMAYKHRQIDSTLAQWCWRSSGGGSYISGWPCLPFVPIYGPSCPRSVIISSVNPSLVSWLWSRCV